MDHALEWDHPSGVIMADYTSAGLLIPIVARSATGALADSGFFGGGEETMDLVPPVVDGFAPTSGSRLGQGQAVAFNVTEAGGIRALWVTVEFPAIGAWEVVWNGSRWASGYSTSSRSSIVDGHRYTVRRNGGWPSDPVFRIQAVDTAGNED